MKRSACLVILVCVVMGGFVFAGEEQDEQEYRPFDWRPESSATIAPGAYNSHPADRMAIRLGGFAVRFRTNARVDSSMGGGGTDLNLESDLGLGRDDTEARIEGHFRFGKRHRLEYGIIAFRRSATRVINQQFMFGDETFVVNATVNTDYSNDLIKIAYRYDIIRRERWDFGMSFGISAYLVDVSLNAMGGGGGVVAEAEDFVAPIPLIGAHFDIKIAEKWYARAGGELFDVNVDNRNGRVSDVRAAIDWYPWRHWGFGAGFNRMSLRYESMNIPNVNFQYVYNGTMVYLSYVR